MCPHELVHWLVALSTMATLALNDIDKILNLWNWAKGQEATTKKTIEECRRQIDVFLVEAGAMGLITPNYQVQKRLQSSESISKKDVPANIWTQYAKKSEFTVLVFTALTGRRSTAGKAKAKTKAARATGVKPKAKAEGQ